MEEAKGRTGKTTSKEEKVRKEASAPRIGGRAIILGRGPQLTSYADLSVSQAVCAYPVKGRHHYSIL